MKNWTADSSASASMKPTPTAGFTPSMNDSAGNSMTSMDIWQGYRPTPSVSARSRSSMSLATLFAAIILLNIHRPMPPKLNMDGFDLVMSPPYIMPSILPKRLLPVGFVFLRARRPQNVKNMVTSIPMAAPPVAMMNAPNNLSKSPLMATIVIFFLRSMTSGISSFPPWVGRCISRSPCQAAVSAVLSVGHRGVDHVLLLAERLCHGLADEVERGKDLGVGDGVEDMGALATCTDHAFAAQDSEVLRQVGLRDAGRLDEPGDGHLAVSERVDDHLALLVRQRLAHVRVHAVEVVALHGSSGKERYMRLPIYSYTRMFKPH